MCLFQAISGSVKPVCWETSEPIIFHYTTRTYSRDDTISLNFTTSALILLCLSLVNIPLCWVIFGMFHYSFTTLDLLRA